MHNQMVKGMDAFAASYDNIQFVLRPAKKLVEKAKITTGQFVLDVACGTGWATLEAAQAIGTTGKIIGIDISKKMVSIAIDKAVHKNLTNIHYCCGDAEKLDFDDSMFDTVICASSIFFLHDIPKALCEWHRVLKPGGIIAFTSFGPRFLQPGLQPLGKLLSQFDGLPPAVPAFLGRTNSLKKCRELLKMANFKEIETITEQLNLYFSDFKDYWRQIMHSFVGMRLNQLGSSDVERLKIAHNAEIKTIFPDNNIHIEIPTIFSLAKKP